MGYKEPDNEELKYDVHFWIGKYSTQDEYATAAYKTVELDTLLDDRPIQHREVQGHESSMLDITLNLSLFSKVEPKPVFDVCSLKPMNRGFSTSRSKQTKR